MSLLKYTYFCREPLWRRSTIKWSKTKIRRLFRCIADLLTLKEPSIGRFRFSMSYSFLNILSNRNRPTSPFCYCPRVYSDFSSLDEQWDVFDHADSSWLLRFIMPNSSFLSRKVRFYDFATDSITFRLRNIQARSQNLEVWDMPQGT